VRIHREVLGALVHATQAAHRGAGPRLAQEIARQLCVERDWQHRHLSHHSPHGIHPAQDADDVIPELFQQRRVLLHLRIPQGRRV
jgi:hypothetical protein